MGKLAVLYREKIDLVAQKLAIIELVNGNRLTPMVNIEPKILEKLSKPWQEALVVKLLGKNLGFNIKKSKLTSTWKLVGSFKIMDIGNYYFMVVFDEAGDRNKVINGGPWMITSCQ